VSSVSYFPGPMGGNLRPGGWAVRTVGRPRAGLQPMPPAVADNPRGRRSDALLVERCPVFNEVALDVVETNRPGFLAIDLVEMLRNEPQARGDRLLPG
jgi:hypothetical protein